MEAIEQGDKKAKFSYFGEILPNNDRSNAILAQRREEEQRRKEEAERVSQTGIFLTSACVCRSSNSRSSERRNAKRRKERRRRSRREI
jgi:hypothetical protein